VYVNSVPRVRIPLSPPDIKDNALFERSLRQLVAGLLRAALRKYIRYQVFLIQSSNSIPVRLPLRAVPTVPVFAVSAAYRSLRIELIAGSHATEGYESRQVRKEAAAVTDSVCRGEAQLSVVSANSFRITPRKRGQVSTCNKNVTSAPSIFMRKLPCLI
jgi:hypothetical protein